MRCFLLFRKKCDETPDAEGHCQTCVRLHLQCLGFGTRRPDWMRVCTLHICLYFSSLTSPLLSVRTMSCGFGIRCAACALQDSNKLVEFRTEITNFLLQNGMVKGHSANANSAADISQTD